MNKDELKRLANEYAHCYAFVGDDTMPLKQAELFTAIDQLAAENAQLQARVKQLEDSLLNEITAEAQKMGLYE